MVDDHALKLERQAVELRVVCDVGNEIREAVGDALRADPSLAGKEAGQVVLDHARAGARGGDDDGVLLRESYLRSGRFEQAEALLNVPLERRPSSVSSKTSRWAWLSPIRITSNPRDERRLARVHGAAGAT